MNAKASEPGFDRARAMLNGHPAADQLAALYAPLLSGESADGFVIAHVGQSLDGQIATSTGASRYITGHENIMHIHRLRALADAVVVGASTVEFD
ncbi:MAG TPA: dihydrofolate reductase family protein, partial [Polyangiaceae bacterium]|nr:dihydrofolate reductase family protein [Polyangiaceae bacterium]